MDIGELHLAVLHEAFVYIVHVSPNLSHQILHLLCSDDVFLCEEVNESLLGYTAHPESVHHRRLWIFGPDKPVNEVCVEPGLFDIMLHQVQLLEQGFDISPVGQLSKWF